MNLLDVTQFDIPEEALQLAESVIDKKSHGELSVRDCISLMMDNPKNEYQEALQMAIKKNETIKAEVIEKASKTDFRAFLHSVLEGEMENFVPTLHEIRDTDPVEYHKTLQGWAKITLPTQKDVNVDINIDQKISMYDRMKQQYGYSAQIEEATVINDNPLPASNEDAVASDPIEETPISQRLASTFDPMFFEQPQPTTPTHPSHNFKTLDNPWDDTDDCQEYENE